MIQINQSAHILRHVIAIGILVFNLVFIQGIEVGIVWEFIAYAFSDDYGLRIKN